MRHIEIRPLRSPDVAELLPLISGYVSPAKYVVSKRETPALMTIELRLVELEQPYRKPPDLVDEAEAARYASVAAAGFSWAAYAGDQPVGLALAEPRDWNRSLWVHEFRIADGWRGQGLGRRLMLTLFEQAQTAGLRIVVCETQNTNVPAIRFYRALGFVLDAVDLSLYTNADVEQGEVAIFMKRRLG